MHKKAVNWSIWIPVILSAMTMISGITLKVLDKVDFTKPNVTVVTNYVMLQTDPVAKSQRTAKTLEYAERHITLPQLMLTNTTSKTNRTYGLYFNFKK